MNAKEYYYGPFRGHFNEFVGQPNAHSHGGDQGTFISLGIKDEWVSHVPSDQRQLFCCALAFTVLIDQAMYTYYFLQGECKEDYRTFQKMTLYPQFEYGISSRTVAPWNLLHNLIERTATPRQGFGGTFKEFSQFLANDLREFFQEHGNKFSEATWEKTGARMLDDRDVVGGEYGAIFGRALEGAAERGAT